MLSLSKKEFFTLVLIVCLSQYTLPQQASAQTASAQAKYDFFFFKKGIVDKNKGKYADAIADFTLFINDHKKQPYAQAYYFRAHCHYYIKDYDKSINDFNSYKKLMPNEIDGDMGAARCYAEMGKREQAVAAFRAAEVLKPESTVVLNELGLALCHSNDYQNGIVKFQQALKIDSSIAVVYNNLGAATYFYQDVNRPHEADMRKARDLFTACLSRDSSYLLARRNRAAMHYFLKAYDKAIADLKRCKQQDRQDATTHFYLGVSYLAKNNWDEAERNLLKVLEINPNSDIAYEELGEVARLRADYPKAIAAYQKAQSLAPKNELYQGFCDYKMAIVAATQKDEKTMLTYLRAAKKRNLFTDRDVYNEFMHHAVFQPFMGNLKLQRFIENLYTIKKTNKFLSPELRWFKMNR